MPMAGMMGISPAVASKVAFGTDGNAATVTLVLTADELAAIKALAEQQAKQMGMTAPPGMGGPMPGGAPPPPPPAPSGQPIKRPGM